MAVRRRPLAGPGDHDVDRLPDLDVLADGDDRGAVERRKRLGRNPVGGHPALAEPFVAAAHGFHRHTWALTHVDARLAGRGSRAVMQAAQPPQRSEAPELVAAVRHLEGVDIERREQLALV
jgi:hypothetical protein